MEFRQQGAQDDVKDYGALTNTWIDSEDEEDRTSRERHGRGGTSSSSAAPKRHQHQFMGGVDEDDELMKKNIHELTRDILQVKRETKAYEAQLPIIDEPWTNDVRSVADCRFHQWGESEASTYYTKEIANKVDDRDKIWHAYKIELLGDNGRVWAWFIGATSHIQDDLTRVLVQIVTGRAPRRVTDGEKPAEFSRYTLLQQVGHMLYRREWNLNFFKFKVLPKESALLNNRSLSPYERAKLETQSIQDHSGWAVTAPALREGRCGLNFWNPAEEMIQLRWGVSLRHLRDLVNPDDPHCKMWTFADIFERTIKPKCGSGMSYVEYLRKWHPEHVSERVDWFLSPSCYRCNWFKMVFDGGISIYAQAPRPIIKGDRFVYVELFLT